MPIRFHLDEHISTNIAAGLRRRGIDVTTTAEAGLTGADDGAQLVFAASHVRVMVTHDADFLRLHAEGTIHGGIAYCTVGALTVGELLRPLVLIYDLLSVEEMENRIEFLWRIIMAARNASLSTSTRSNTKSRRATSRSH